MITLLFLFVLLAKIIIDGIQLVHEIIRHSNEDTGPLFSHVSGYVAFSTTNAIVYTLDSFI
jgi:hypothetical protein